MSALFNIGYGLYVITSNDGKKDNGMIGNAVAQVASSPNRIMVSINKANYSHDVIKETGKMNVNCLSVDAPFSVFENFGFKSGRDNDKFADGVAKRSANGLAVLPQYVNACISLKVETYVDMGSHGMFLCSVDEELTLSEKETMTYTYYQNNVKPNPAASSKKGWVCKICGWVYEGEELPADLICPLCKHPASDFEPLV
jgi:flavin reductase (DIM6/NTAB) family NADH-FMN oxidoreductase RutF